jgi:hypothetical protein
MSESVYRRLAHKEGAPIAHDHPDAAWLRSVMGVTIWIAARCRPDIVDTNNMSCLSAARRHAES